MEREEEISSLIDAQVCAQVERLEDPKNAAKGRFSRDFDSLLRDLRKEVDELNGEITKFIRETAYALTPEAVKTLERMRDEAGDVCNFAGAVILACDKMLENKKKD